MLIILKPLLSITFYKKVKVKNILISQEFSPLKTGIELDHEMVEIYILLGLYLFLILEKLNKTIGTPPIKLRELYKDKLAKDLGGYAE